LILTVTVRPPGPCRTSPILHRPWTGRRPRSRQAPPSPSGRSSRSPRICVGGSVRRDDDPLSA
jgi:hypothetical protein